MKRYVLAICWLACLGLVAADCSGQQIEWQFGYAIVGGELAVYAPVCPGDHVVKVEVHEAPERGKDGNFKLLWQASDPTDQSTKDGLVVLGKGFETVEAGPPERFPARLSISIETAGRRLMSQGREHPADLPEYPAGTPAAEMTFNTASGPQTFDQIRSQPQRCPTTPV